MLDQIQTEGHWAAADWLLLFGHIDHPTASLTDLLEKFVVANLDARLLRNGWIARGWHRTLPQAGLLQRMLAEESFRLGGGRQQFLDSPAQVCIVGASHLQKCLPLWLGFQMQCSLKEALFVRFGRVHVAR